MAYGKIVNNKIVYATIKNGALVTDNGIVWCAPSQYAEYGYYPVHNVADDGELEVVDGVLMNYIGKPQEPDAHARKVGELSRFEPLMEALERMIAAQGVTEDDKAMAAERIALRDELGKVVQTETGDGSAENPYAWNGGLVVSGKWYKTPSNYLWQAIADGTPDNETDSNYFDVIGL